MSTQSVARITYRIAGAKVKVICAFGINNTKGVPQTVGILESYPLVTNQTIDFVRISLGRAGSIVAGVVIAQEANIIAKVCSKGIPETKIGIQFYVCSGGSSSIRNPANVGPPHPCIETAGWRKIKPALNGWPVTSL